MFLRATLALKTSNNARLLTEHVVVDWAQSSAGNIDRDEAADAEASRVCGAPDHDSECKQRGPGTRGRTAAHHTLVSG